MFGWSSYSLPGFAVNDAPFDGGAWCASPATTNYQYSSGDQGIYQDLPWLMDGDVISLSAWLKSRSSGCNGGATMNLIHASSDSSSFIYFSVTATEWTHVQYDGVVHITEGQTPRLGLGSFYPCGPNYSLYAGAVDQVSLTITDPVGIPARRDNAYLLTYDPGTGIVRIATSVPMVGPIRCTDVRGREMMIRAGRTGDQQVELNMDHLACGLYVLFGNTAAGQIVARFVKP